MYSTIFTSCRYSLLLMYSFISIHLYKYTNTCIYYSGYETYSLHIKDLRTNTLLPDRIEGTDGSVEWDRDSSRVFYMTMDEEHRPNKVQYTIRITMHTMTIANAYLFL